MLRDRCEIDEMNFFLSENKFIGKFLMKQQRVHDSCEINCTIVYTEIPKVSIATFLASLYENLSVLIV